MTQSERLLRAYNNIQTLRRGLQLIENRLPPMLQAQRYLGIDVAELDAEQQAAIVEPVQFDFSEALKHLRQGKRVRRAKWEKRLRWIELKSWIIGINIGGVVVDWSPLHSLDLLAADWVLVEEEVKSETPAAGQAIGSGDALPGEVD